MKPAHGESLTFLSGIRGDPLQEAPHGGVIVEPMPRRGAPARRSDQDGLAPIPKGAEPILVGGVVPDVDRKPGGAKALEQPQSPRTLVRRRGLELHHAGAM